MATTHFYQVQDWVVMHAVRLEPGESVTFDSTDWTENHVVIEARFLEMACDVELLLDEDANLESPTTALPLESYPDGGYSTRHWTPLNGPNVGMRITNTSDGDGDVAVSGRIPRIKNIAH